MTMTRVKTAAANADMFANEAGYQEDVVTNDDLQAMKDMIGDIKKDPSLLYRLSSLQGSYGNNEAAVVASTGDDHRNVVRAVASNTNKNCENHPISTIYDDDADDVSSIGMRSSSDHSNSFHNTVGGSSCHVGGTQQRLQPQAMATTKEQAARVGAAFARASGSAAQRTNRDAEIALRMQSLMAKRELKKQKQNLGLMSRTLPSPKKNYQKQQPPPPLPQQQHDCFPSKKASTGVNSSATEVVSGGSMAAASNLVISFEHADNVVSSPKVDSSTRLKKVQHKDLDHNDNSTYPHPSFRDTDYNKQEAVPQPIFCNRDNQQQQPEDLNGNQTSHTVPSSLQQDEQQHQQQKKSYHGHIKQSQQPPTQKKGPSQEESLAAAHNKLQTSNKTSVNCLLWSDYNGHSGRYTGEVNEKYLPHGRGEMMYDRGVIQTGIWYDGVLDTEDVGHGRDDSRRNKDGGPAQKEDMPETLPNYSCGDKGRREDMIIASKKDTAAAVALLRKNDAAWVRRSDGRWTYAIVKDRTYDESGEVETIRFKVNPRGSTKAFPKSQWGTYVRRTKKQAQVPSAAHTTADICIKGSKRSSALSNFLDNQSIEVRNSIHNSNFAEDGSVNSAHSAPMARNGNNQRSNLTTGKMKIRTRSRSRSRHRKNITTFPSLLSSSMSVSELNEGNDNENWETASGSGYRLRGIDP